MTWRIEKHCQSVHCPGWTAIWTRCTTVLRVPFRRRDDAESYTAARPTGPTVAGNPQGSGDKMRPVGSEDQ